MLPIAFSIDLFPPDYFAIVFEPRVRLARYFPSRFGKAEEKKKGSDSIESRAAIPENGATLLFFSQVGDISCMDETRHGGSRHDGERQNKEARRNPPLAAYFKGQQGIVRPVWVRYGTAIFVIAGAVLINQMMVLAGAHRMYLIFYPFIVLATLIGGIGPGIVSIALSCLAAGVLWGGPFGHLGIATSADAVGMGVFIVGNVLAVWICELLRRAGRNATEQAQILEESEHRLSMAQKAGQVGVFDWDMRSGRVVWSPEQEKLFGLQVGNFQQTFDGWANRVHPEDLARLNLFFKEWKESNREMNSWEFRIQHPDGECRWIEASGQIMRSPSGEALRMIGTNRDVTERHRAEEALLLRERQLMEAQRLAHLGSWEWDIQSDTAIWSEELFRIFGIDPNRPPVRYHDRAKFYTPESWARLDAAVQTALKTGASYQESLELKRSDGMRRWVLAHGEAKRDPAGNIVGLRGTLQDVTEARQAEERLRQSAAELRQIIDLVPHFIFIKDWDGNILTANQALAEAYNTTVDELTGRPQSQFQKEKSDLDRMLQDDREVIQTGQTKFIPEESFVDAQGNRRLLQTTKVPFHLSGKETKAVLGVAIEITERKRIEEALRDSENRYRSIFEAVVDAIIIIDEMGIIEAANHSAETLFGYGADEMVGQNVNMLMPSPYHEQHDAYLEHYRRTGERKIIGIGREVFARHKNGSVFPIRLAVSEMRVGSRRLFTGQVHDITERRKAEESIRESEERLRLAQQVARVGTFEWSIAGGVNRWAPELEALYGLPKGGFKQTIEAWLEMIHPEDRAAAEQQMHEALKTGAFEGEWRVLWPDGTVHWLAGRGRVFRDGSGQPLRMVGVNIDITRRKQMEQEYQRATDTALAANAAKDRFLAILSHELRTPLTPVLMTISARETDTALAPELREELSMVRRNLELEARLIDDLLDLNRISRGKIALRLQPTDLHNCLRNVLAICREEIAMRGLSLEVVMDASEHNVNGDGGRLQQVFWNLLKNATKFTADGGRITIQTSNPTPETVRTEVADTGVGINPRTIPSLFVAFEQGEMRTAGHLGGLGLGLAICKAVVDLHNGKVWVESEGEGRGARFFVELPITRVEPTERGGVPERPGPQWSSLQWSPKIDNRNVRILLVEDNADTMRILCRLLERAGCEVSTARTMQTARAMARETRERGGSFDLLISDLGLPDGDGKDLMRELREQDGLQGVAISGYGMEEDVEKSLAAGFDEHLTKPIQIKELQTAISRLLAKIASKRSSYQHLSCEIDGSHPDA